MTEKKPLVVVLSRNYSTGLSVIRSLGAAGYTVDLVANAHREGISSVAAASKYVRNYVEVVSKKVKDGNDDELIAELLKYSTHEDKPVLFPTDDYTVSVMDLNREKLRGIFRMPFVENGDEGTLTFYMDKTVQGNMASQAGLLVPKEWKISLREEICIPHDISFPCFVKPLESITGYKREMKSCGDIEALIRHLSRLQRKFSNRDILIQEFLSIDDEIDISGVCFDQEIIIPAIIKKIRVAQHEKGVTLAGKVLPLEELEQDIQEKIIRTMQQFHYTGMFDMELNVVDGKIYFNEINFRSGGPNYAYYASGINLPALAVKGIIGTPCQTVEEKTITYGKSFVYEKVAWEDYINGYLTKKELNDCIDAVDIKLLYNEEDPKPGIIFKRKMKKTAMHKKYRNIKRQVINKLKKHLRFLRSVKHFILRYPQMKKKNKRNPHADRPRVMVAGRNYCSNLCMARSLGEAGYDVEILKIFQVKPKPWNLLKKVRPDAYSNYIKAYYVCVSRRRSKRIVKRLIRLADTNNKMLLLPADDLVASIADDYLDKLSEYYVLPNIMNKQGEINRLMAKEVQKEMAREAGLPVLKSCVIRTSSGKFEIPESVSYPCFIKPNVSKRSSKSRMRKCDNEESLRQAITEMSSTRDVEMLVEDYVEIKHEYSLLGISTCKAGAIGPGYFVAEDGGQNEHRGVAITGRVLSCSTDHDLIENLISFVSKLGFDGLYDIDIIETMDGKKYFVELNLRFGASGYAITRCGVNLPGMFADYMLFGKMFDKNCKITNSGKRFVSEKVLLEEYAKGRVSKKKFRECMNEADIYFIKNSEDKQAYRHFRKFYLIAACMRIFNRMRGDF